MGGNSPDESSCIEKRINEFIEISEYGEYIK